MDDRVPLMAGLDVSRETERALNVFLDRVCQWSPKINLVSRDSLSDLRTRHLLDSAQLFAHLRPSQKSWVDLGSGGGFPGLVIAILAKELRPDLRLTMVESDRRKATFLRVIVSELLLSAVVISARLEVVPPLQADVVSARALAPLVKLLGMAERHLAPTGTALLLKGEAYSSEVAAARLTWRFDIEEIASVTQDGAALLKIKDIRLARPAT